MQVAEHEGLAVGGELKVETVGTALYDLAIFLFVQFNLYAACEWDVVPVDIVACQVILLESDRLHVRP